VENALRFAEEFRILVGIVDLDGPHGGEVSQVGLEPFAGLTRLGAPVGFDVFIDGVVGGESPEGGGDLYRLLVVEEHPAGETAFKMVGGAVGKPGGVITEGLAAVHDALPVETRRPDSDAPFEVILHRDGNGRHMPVVAPVVAESGPVAGTVGKAPGFVAEGHRLGRKGPQGAVTHHHSVGIAAELGPRRTILQVILPLVFDHLGPLHERIKEGVVVMFPEALPPVTPRLQKIHLPAGPCGSHGLAVELNAVQRITVAAPVVHVKAAVVVGEKRRVPPPDAEPLHQGLPFISLGIGAHPYREFAGIGGTENQHGVADDAHRGGTQLIIPRVPGAQEPAGDILPLDHVGTVPVPPLVGRKKIVIALEVHNHRVGGGPVPAPRGKIGNGGIAVIEIDRITIAFLPLAPDSLRHTRHDHHQQNREQISDT